MSFKTTKSTHAVSNAFKGFGFTCVSDGFYEYQSVKRTREQVWVKDVSETSEMRWHVYFNRDGHVTGYSSGHGYAETHDEGRHLGVWRRRFTPAMCRELLLSNLAESMGEWQPHYVSRKKVA
jgi:hypothetical protein